MLGFIKRHTILVIFLITAACLSFAFPALGLESKSPGSYAPSSVYDPISNRFLMVFTDVDEFSIPAIYGIFVRPDASPEGVPFRISQEGSFIPYDARPTIAFDTRKGRFLVAWHDWSSGSADVFGSILNSSGYPEVTGIAIANGESDEQFPVASYSPHAGSFLLSWEDDSAGDMDVHARTITTGEDKNAEAILGQDRTVFKTPGDQRAISIAYFGDGQRRGYYMLAFEDHSKGKTAPSISGQLLEADTGKPLMPVSQGLDISGELGGHAPSVSATSWESIPFMVAWHGQGGELRTRYMDTAGSALPPFDIVFEPYGREGAAGRVKVSSDHSTGRSALFWQESTGGLHDIYASFIEPGDTSGSVYHVMQVAGEDDRDEINLEVSYNSRMPSFLVAYESTDYLTSFNILLTSVTDPDYPEISVVDPVYPFEDLSVEYPGVLFNTSVSHTLSLYNDSPFSALRVMDINTSGPFTIAGENCTLESLVPSGAPCSITVEFSPEARGPLTGNLSITSNDPNEPNTLLHLSGNSLAPALEITDTSMPPDDSLLDFGLVRIGEKSEGTVTVRNTGDHVLSLGQIHGLTSSEFGILQDNCSLQMLLPSTHCTIVLFASPAYVGPSTASLWITSDAPDDGDVLVGLRAEGAEASVEEAGARELSFGAVAIGERTESEIVIRNSGKAPLSIGNIAAEGKAYYFDTDGCRGAELASGGSCRIGVAFAPEDTLAYSAKVTLQSNDPQKPEATYHLSGFGATAIASVHAEDGGGRHIEFGSLETGRSITRRVRLTNLGRAPLLSGYPSITGEGLGIAYDGCGGRSLPYAASCDISVRFTPEGAGEFPGLLVIPSNDPEEGDIQVSISGAGI